MSDRRFPGDMRHGRWKRAVARPRARTVAMTIFGDDTARSMERLPDCRLGFCYHAATTLAQTRTKEAKVWSVGILGSPLAWVFLVLRSFALIALRNSFRRTDGKSVSRQSLGNASESAHRNIHKLRP